MFCKFQHHSMQIFFKMANLCFLKTEKVATTPPSPSDFDGLPYPRVRWYPQFFFHENYRKRCKRDYLLPLVTFFSVLERPGENRKDNLPLVRRGLKRFKQLLCIAFDTHTSVKTNSLTHFRGRQFMKYRHSCTTFL